MAPTAAPRTGRRSVSELALHPPGRDRGHDPPAREEVERGERASGRLRVSAAGTISADTPSSSRVVLPGEEAERDERLGNRPVDGRVLGRHEQVVGGPSRSRSRPPRRPRRRPRAPSAASAGPCSGGSGRGGGHSSRAPLPFLPGISSSVWRRIGSAWRSFGRCAASLQRITSAREAVGALTPPIMCGPRISLQIVSAPAAIAASAPITT